jgi:hypothetical protein
MITPVHTTKLIAMCLLASALCACSAKRKPEADKDAGRDAGELEDAAARDSGSGAGGAGGAGSGGESGEQGGGNGGSGGATPNAMCAPFGDVCRSGSDCCSGLCDAADNTCGSSIAQCTPNGAACSGPTECCSLSCIAGECGSSACVSDGASCAVGAECCSGNCDSGSCVALNTMCRTGGNECSDNSQCCSSLCESGRCSLGASFCVQTGDVCARDSECCGSRCDIADGATIGTCGVPPAGASSCSGDVDGTVCNGCGSCCSRLCAPYQDTGVSVCQRATGCRPNGGLCRQDNDCCGAAGTGLPGDGKVTCEKESGQDVGICRNPTGCNPQGNVCHYKDYACSISSARNACCAAPGNSGECQLDRLGVPRCNGLGDTCRAEGETCASSDDCCDDRPCVADGSGVLRCFNGGTCVPSGGSCTASADCCRGATCITAVGSNQGTCSASEQAPAAGSGGAGSGGAGSGGAGSGGAGSGGAAGAAGSEPPPVCAEFGQQCQMDSDCCSDLPCYEGYCIYPLL